ncbi:ATP synthase subunit b 1 [Gryllus bimaculatus]|nr:ATP synthase subunit b 1 [Gryllus bimaculatus]
MRRLCEDGGEDREEDKSVDERRAGRGQRRDGGDWMVTGTWAGRGQLQDRGGRDDGDKTSGFGWGCGGGSCRQIPAAAAEAGCWKQKCKGLSRVGGGGGGGGYGGFSGFGGFGEEKPVHHHHHHDHHVDHHVKHSGGKALALKGLLVPLAGVALLGAAAALVSNPVLLQLGVISGRRRRRRALRAGAEEDSERALRQRLADIALLEKFMAGQLLANFLSCSGLAGAGGAGAAASGARGTPVPSARCLERVTCELHHPAAEVTQLEKHVMQIVTSEILENEYIPDEVKRRVKTAAKIGLESESCEEFHCTDLER